jgi:hypothetical protein
MKFEFEHMVVVVALLACCLIGKGCHDEHAESMAHIQSGHCYNKLPGTERGQWEICK